MSGESKTGVMRRTLMWGVAAVGALSAPLGAAVAGEAKDGPIATTLSGRVRGYNDGPVKVFKGVPYGAPTGGSNRWLPAKPPAHWNEIKDTSAPGAMSPQNRPAPLAEEQALSQTGPISEDCLTLNITTPAVGPNSGKRPVIVWYHGGGFAGGSGNASSYDARNLVEKQDVVVVTVTHRLNVLGFLYLADLFGPDYADSGNIGMLDCIAALKWVRDNIAQFGGDPANVTIAGQSGGGAKVSTLMAMPAAAGLFQRAISESGAILRGAPKPMAAAAAKRFVDALGVTTIADLQAVSVPKLLAAMDQVRLMTAPVVDGGALPRNPFDPDAPAISRDIPFLCGTTETEATFLPNTPLDPIDDTQLHQLVKATTQVDDAGADNLIAVFRAAYPGKDDLYLFQLLASQATTQKSVIAEAERKADQGGAPVYVYYFVKHTPVRGGKLRAPHTLEIPFVFDSLAHAAPIVGPVTPPMQALADKVSAAWAAFARTGSPNTPHIPTWPAFDTKTRSMMVIDDAFQVANDPLRDTRIALGKIAPPRPPGP